ncbi:NAD(+) diphosphatase [Actinocrispum sp. NPDC049592]|uniref:NAD(+) diphosphatase n=1 Tax=Actinocrispum sp. NPDC049592 TaxID=3154835 RepID=UPI003446C3DA
MPDLAYNALTLDRATAHRADPAWLATQRSRPDARVIAFHDGEIHDAPVTPDTEAVFLGLDGDTPVFAADIPEPHGPTRDLRAIFSTLDPAEAATLAYARGLLHWTRNQQFCGTCGGATQPTDGGHVRQCQKCGKLLFPRIEPAIIVLVTWQDTCLLARHRNARSYSTLAGFVEIGENLETAVHREVHEEAGVRLASVHYQASQAWPFPSGLMIGYRAEAASPDIQVDGSELDEARWFTPAEVRAMGEHRTDSIEHHLITDWLARTPPRNGTPR